MIKVAQHIDFGTLYIKPAFVFVDQDGHVKLQFEVDTSSALAYLYDTLCKELGIAVVDGFPAGHLNDNRAFYLGMNSQLRKGNDELILTFQH